MAYDVQLTVILYKKKHYVSHIAALSLGESLQDTAILAFGNRILIEIKPKDKHLIKDLPIYDMDSMLNSFVPADKAAELIKVNKKDCFPLDDMQFISLSKMPMKNKYSLRFSLPHVKIFGTYYILCGKQKDVNTRLFIMPE